MVAFCDYQFRADNYFKPYHKQVIKKHSFLNNRKDFLASGTYVTIDRKRNSSYCTSPAVKKTFHGDQWMTLEIEVRGDMIRHFVNGQEILHFEDPRYNPEHAIGKTFIKNGDDKVKQGYISLQSNSHPMDFRKIEITEY